MTSPEVVQEVVQRIIASYDPDQIVLFGSYARGTNGPDSDVDLLVIKDSSIPREKRGLNVKRMFYGSAVPVHLLFATRREVEEESREKYSLVNCIVTWGVVVYSKEHSFSDRI